MKIGRRRLFCMLLCVSCFMIALVGNMTARSVDNIECINILLTSNFGYSSPLDYWAIYDPSQRKLELDTRPFRSAPILSPDGKYAVYADVATDQPLQFALTDLKIKPTIHIWLVRTVDGAPINPVIMGDLWEVFWSPDSRWVAYMGTGDDDPNNDLKMILIETATGEKVELSNREWTFQGSPWSADGRYFAYTSGRWGGGDLALYLMSMFNQQSIELISEPLAALWHPTANFLFLNYQNDRVGIYDVKANRLIDYPTLTASNSLLWLSSEQGIMVMNQIAMLDGRSLTQNVPAAEYVVGQSSSGNRLYYVANTVYSTTRLSTYDIEQELAADTDLTLTGDQRWRIWFELGSQGQIDIVYLDFETGIRTTVIDNFGQHVIIGNAQIDPSNYRHLGSLARIQHWSPNYDYVALLWLEGSKPTQPLAPVSHWQLTWGKVENSHPTFSTIDLPLPIQDFSPDLFWFSSGRAVGITQWDDTSSRHRLLIVNLVDGTITEPYPTLKYARSLEVSTAEVDYAFWWLDESGESGIDIYDSTPTLSTKLQSPMGSAYIDPRFSRGRVARSPEGKFAVAWIPMSIPYDYIDNRPRVPIVGSVELYSSNGQSLKQRIWLTSTSSPQLRWTTCLAR